MRCARQRDEEQEEHRQREAHQGVLRRVDGEAAQQLEEEEGGEGEADEKEAVLRAALETL